MCGIVVITACWCQCDQCQHGTTPYVSTIDIHFHFSTAVGPSFTISII
jgi:hypothetical protein